MSCLNFLTDKIKMASNSSYLFVAAIDFGTTYSGYAFSSKDDYNNGNKLKIYSNTWNAGERSLIASKTPTVLLLDKNQNFKAFGFDAENMYTTMCAPDDSDSDTDDDEPKKPKENPKEMYYFQRFKMELHKTKVHWHSSPRIKCEGTNQQCLSDLKSHVEN